MPCVVEGLSELARRIYVGSTKRWGESMATALIGLDPKFTAAVELIERCAGSGAHVLVTGETGTGKELFARAVSLLSDGGAAPFLSVNCAQYHDGQLVASELFGHKKGSFTGAASDHVGLFEAASGGTVFLDEVTELPPAAQAMLLRALSEGEVVPVGDTRPRRVHVRVVAATNGDVPALVQSGRFRMDLYYRLRGLHLRVPPVRERGHDWELIRDHYLRRLGLASRREKQFSHEALHVLSGYPWPGNVRELRSLVEAGFHLSDGTLIEPRHFLDSLEEATRMSQLRAVPVCGVEAGCYETMVERRGSFWDVVYRPYMDRDLNRAQVRSIVSRGLQATRGSYKRLLAMFGMPEGEYLRFMDFLRHNRLKPES